MDMDKGPALKVRSILCDIAGSGERQKLVMEIYFETIQNGASNEQLLRRMTNILAFGLNHDSWPWTYERGEYRRGSIKNPTDEQQAVLDMVEYKPPTA